MKDQLKKICSDLSASSLNTTPSIGDTVIRTEETHQLECESGTDTKDVLYSQIALIVNLIGPLIKTEKKNQPSPSFNKPKRHPFDSKALTDLSFVNPSFGSRLPRQNPRTHGYRMKLFCLLLQPDFDNPNEPIVLSVLECSSTWQLCKQVSMWSSLAR